MQSVSRTRGALRNAAFDRNVPLERLGEAVNEPSSRWAEQVARHRPYLYKYALSRLWNRTAAEDAVQETLLAALECEHSFNGDSALRTWLTGILKHKIADWPRREQRVGNGEAASGADLEH